MNTETIQLTIEQLFEIYLDAAYDRPGAISAYCELRGIEPPDDLDVISMYGEGIDEAEHAELVRIFGSAERIPEILLTNKWST